MRENIKNMALLGPPSDILDWFDVDCTFVNHVATQKNCMKNSTQINAYCWFPWQRLQLRKLF